MDDTTRSRALGMISHGLFVIGVRQGDQINAFTATWLSQCSFRPPRVMLAVRATSDNHTMIQGDRVFTVNLLTQDQQEIARSFFKKPSHEDGRLNGFAYRTGLAGCPILSDALGHLECTVVGMIPAGDHTIMLGEVMDASCKKEAAPLTLADTPWSYQR